MVPTLSTIGLSRTHICRFGAPAIHAVDPAIFSRRYFMRCMACGFCNDQCCNHGVDIDVGNAERLIALGPEFEARVGVPRENWFSTAPETDLEFPTGGYLRTQVRGGKCVFAARGGRGCIIHAYCFEKNLDYHALKPLVSILFPLTFENGVLVPSSEIADGSLVCGGNGPTLYDGVREELRYYFGDDFVCELDQLARR
ncbi:MAG TPA: hypothetical protein VMJ73_11850 [Rhizomicrobium sp.]|nr:hypothetical protein [Rhizomicrobium sp.]